MSTELPPAQSGKPLSAYVMWTVGVVAIVGILGYYLYQAIDSLSLEQRQATATVAGKGYQEGGTSYFTEVIGNQRVVRPVATPDYFFLKLKIDGQETVAVVAPHWYEQVHVGDRLRVTCQRRRLSGALEVVSVDALAKG